MTSTPAPDRVRTRAPGKINVHLSVGALQDDGYHDIATARELGLRTCWVRRRAGRPGSGATPPPLSAARPDHQVRSLAELADALTPAWQEARPS